MPKDLDFENIERIDILEAQFKDGHYEESELFKLGNGYLVRKSTDRVLPEVTCLFDDQVRASTYFNEIDYDYLDLDNLWRLSDKVRPNCCLKCSDNYLPNPNPSLFGGTWQRTGTEYLSYVEKCLIELLPEEKAELLLEIMLPTPPDSNAYDKFLIAKFLLKHSEQ